MEEVPIIPHKLGNMDEVKKTIMIDIIMVEQGLKK